MNAELDRPSSWNGWKILLYCLLLFSILIVLPASADVIVYSQSFESNDGGYSHTGTLDQWQWGVPISGPGSAHTGVNVWATNLAGNVPSNSDSYLTSPAIAVPAISGTQIARVRFWGWIAVDEMLDRGEFQVSKDGVNWVTKSELFHTMQGTWTGPGSTCRIMRGETSTCDSNFTQMVQMHSRSPFITWPDCTSTM